MKWSEIEKIYQEAEVPDEIINLLQLTDEAFEITSLPSEVVSYYEKNGLKQISLQKIKLKSYIKLKLVFIL